MKILYVNISEERAYEGHKLFDMEWAEGLSMISDVDLIQPSEGWFSNDNGRVNLITYNQNLKGITWLSRGIFNKGLLKRIDLYQKAKNARLYKFIENLDEKNNYDVILAAHLDYLMFLFRFWNSKITKKLYMIEHSPEIYSKWVYRDTSLFFKNQIYHVVMEKAAVRFYIEKMHISPNRIKYIPHPLNQVDYLGKSDVKKYNVVALSNSNSDKKIKKIIEQEERVGFLRKKRISMIVRSKEIEYDSEYLKVFTGRLSLSFEEFYGYILKSDVVVLPFGEEFGARTSGTIIDGLSNNKPVIGTSFATMCQYADEYPSVCKVYNTIDELCLLIEEFVKNKEERQMTLDFNSFKNSRSKSAMKKLYLDSFGR